MIWTAQPSPLLVLPFALFSRVRMNRLQAKRPQLVFLLLAALIFCVSVLAQSSSPAFRPIEEAQAPPALVRSVEMVTDKDGPGLEIIATRPITPIITQLDSPPRLVIDLAKSYVPVPRQRVMVHRDLVNQVRVNQYQSDPPAVRLVVDLAKPCEYSWDSAGNRLTVRIYAAGQKPANLAARSEPAAAPAAPALLPTSGVSPTERSREPVVLETSLAAGSAVIAGTDATRLRLARGGEVRVCPGTTISVTAAPGRDELMLGMSTGAIETHYALKDSADSVVTPDFRIVLVGPGDLHYAISADSQGDTCVRSLPGNTGMAQVSELMGEGVYELRPFEEVVFRGGRLSAPDKALPSDCGCPPSEVPVLRASAESTSPANQVAQNPAGGSNLLPPLPSPTQVSVSNNTPETANLPPGKTDVHVQVDAPFVFNGAAMASQKPAATQDNNLPLKRNQATSPLEITVMAPPAQASAPLAEQDAQAHHGFFHSIKDFMGRIFR